MTLTLYLLNLAIQGTALCALLVLAAAAVRRRPVVIRHAVLQTGMLLILLCPLLTWCGGLTGLSVWRFAARGETAAAERVDATPA